MKLFLIQEIIKKLGNLIVYLMKKEVFIKSEVPSKYSSRKYPFSLYITASSFSTFESIQHTQKQVYSAVVNLQL